MASEGLALGAIQLLLSPETVDAAKRELAGRTSGMEVAPPRAGITEVIVRDPAAFWDATWTR